MSNQALTEKILNLSVELQSATEIYSVGDDEPDLYTVVVGENFMTGYVTYTIFDGEGNSVKDANLRNLIIRLVEKQKTRGEI